METKLHDVDEKLDELETIISLFEAKLDSLPPEVFSDIPQQEQILDKAPMLAPTENPLGGPVSNLPPPPQPPQ